ncbi:response regulator receiver protein [Methylobacterium sp. 4-46]|uniref:histidine kinase n=1 Tax=unclassified Methylobacterium TaxID=2615210 RepID=UPI000165CB1F|nr:MULTISPECIES: histidine kinase [Methylobacterium]ACA19888.1 response regulator receiver protein [Methylobacterium sp. 4-46]WFT79072.1 histidine kinase [Methylobacterium nodulans]
MASVRASRACILIAEDEVLIGFDLADQLALRGFETAGPFTTCADAERWLRSNEPAGAVLDNSLADGPCDALAQDLESRGIPFVVYSGHDHSNESSPVFQRAPWIIKPDSIEEVIGQLSKLIDRR